MKFTDNFSALDAHWQTYILALITSKMVGKTSVVNYTITIEDSDIKTYTFKVTVDKRKKEKKILKIGYLRSDAFKGGRWELTLRPRLMQGEKAPAGVYGIYG